MEERIGKIHKSVKGEEFTILEYFNSSNVTIQFEDKTIIYNRKYGNIVKGNVSNPNNKSVCNIGFMGVGKYSHKFHLKFYKIWHSMIVRCYDKITQEKHPTYKNVTVCEEWHNFQNFAEWVEKNYVEGFQLDKDILLKGNKEYSKNTCCFIPQEINNLITKRNSKRGKYFIGVCKKGKNYRSDLRKYNKSVYLGEFNTELEAFQVYKTEKEKYIKNIAYKWRHKITKECYQALYEYKIEITD